jgi:hypothetical protein
MNSIKISDGLSNLTKTINNEANEILNKLDLDK